jgi:hypothetical protein
VEIRTLVYETRSRVFESRLEVHLKYELGGLNAGTASSRLRKSIMFDLAQKLNLCTCFRCSKEIDNVDDFTIDHKINWRKSDNSVELFFNLNNIAFSHHLCNIKAARRAGKRFPDSRERHLYRVRKDQKRSNEARDEWRKRRREAGLPYT